MIARALNSVRPLWLGCKLTWLRWALREIDPLHRDVPHIVRSINRIESELMGAA